MYQLSRRILTIMLVVSMVLGCTAAVSFAEASGSQKYAAKVLYALDPEDLTHTQYAADAVRSSAEDYPNVEVLGVSDGIAAWNTKYYYGGESGGITDHGDIVRSLTAGLEGPDPTVKNITYKVTSSNPNGFEELNISFRGFAESAGVSGEPSGFLAVQGADTAPTGEFDAEGYSNNFTDIKRITDSEPESSRSNNMGRDNANPDWYSYGETLTLTNEVKGKSVYYVNFSFLSEALLTTGLADISIAEKVPVDYYNEEEYTLVEMANGDCSGNQGSRKGC